MTKKEIEKRTKEAKEIIEMTQFTNNIDVVLDPEVIDIMIKKFEEEKGI